MNSTPSESATSDGHLAAGGQLPEFVDWIVGVLVALGGLMSIVGGTALVFLVDRELLAADIEDGTTQVTVGTADLTAAEQVEVADAIVSWTGAGLLVTGLGMVLIAVGYVVARHRAHRRARADEIVSSYGAFAVLGAIATAVLSFVPVSPALGGALAGYLERAESDRTISVGALAGFLPVLPVLAILVFVLGGLMAGLLAVEQGGMAMVVGATLFLAAMIVASLAAGLGALGGYVGGRFAESRATTD